MLGRSFDKPDEAVASLNVFNRVGSMVFTRARWANWMDSVNGRGIEGSLAFWCCLRRCAACADREEVYTLAG